MQVAGSGFGGSGNIPPNTYNHGELLRLAVLELRGIRAELRTLNEMIQEIGSPGLQGAAQGLRDAFTEEIER